jgi:hypothetical protein
MSKAYVAPGGSTVRRSAPPPEHPSRTPWCRSASPSILAGHHSLFLSQEVYVCGGGGGGIHCTRVLGSSTSSLTISVRFGWKYNLMLIDHQSFISKNFIFELLILRKHRFYWWLAWLHFCNSLVFALYIKIYILYILCTEQPSRCTLLGQEEIHNLWYHE